MPFEILLVLGILAGTIVILATGLLRMDVTALLVMVLVALLGLVPAREAIGGFANPAVLTVAGMFVISAGLSRTGVAGFLGEWILRTWGGGERRVMTAITLVSGLMSGFMNNVGVTAMMLPVVVSIARKSSIPPSKLLIPMALGAQLGGFTTLIGTAPNLLAADSLLDAGLEPFGLFAFTPVGLVLLVVGTILITTVGPRILPVRVPEAGGAPVDRPGIRRDVELAERLFFLVVPSHSLLEGRTLAESLIGSALGVHVLAVQREGRTIRAPRPDVVLHSGDRILVQGRPDYFMELRGRRHLAAGNEELTAEWLESEEVGLARAEVPAGSRFAGRSAAELDLRSRDGVLVLTMRRGEDFRRRTHFVDEPMQAGDELLLQGSRERLQKIAEGADLRSLEFLEATEAIRRFDLEDRLWSVRVTDDSLLSGRELGRTRLGDAVGFLVLAVGRDDDVTGRREMHLQLGPDFVFRPGDHLMVKTRPEDMVVLRGLQRLEVDVDSDVDPDLLEGGDAGFAEVVLAPRSSLLGKTLRQVNFRSRFGLHVVGIVREGEVVRANLRDETLRFGDALLLYGPVRNQRSLSGEPDLILIRGREAEAPHPRLAPLSLLVTVGALVPVIAGWVPVAIGVLAGAVLMVITRCLTPDQAYRAVDLPTLVLVSGMLSLGAALRETGAVDLMGTGLLDALGGVGPHLMLTALVAITAVGGQIMPASAVVVLMAPIAVSAADVLGVSPYPMVLAVAIASTSLASPVSQPPHALVMAPAGYRMGDYLRLGLPITVLVLVLTVLVTPLFMPF